MNAPHERATTVVLNEDESRRLAQVPDPEHEPVDTLPCELQAGRPGPRMVMAQVSGSDTAWWRLSTGRVNTASRLVKIVDRAI